MLLSTKESTNRQGEKKKEWPITSTKEEEEEEGQSDQKLPGTLCRASSPAASPNASINFSSPRKIEKAEKKSYKKKNLGWMDAMQMGVGWMILSPTGIWRVGGWIGWVLLAHSSILSHCSYLLAMDDPLCSHYPIPLTHSLWL